MMRKLPDCPRCEDDELFLVRHATWIVIRCYECGWNHTLMPRPADDALDGAIAEAVKQATESK